MRKIVAGVLVFSTLLVAAEETNDSQEPPPVTKRSAWKAGLFAFSGFLIVIGGIVLISLDGGTKTHHHNDYCNP